MCVMFINGNDFKQFYNDPKIWDEETRHEEFVINLNGQTIECTLEENEDVIDLLDDNDSVGLSYGNIISSPLNRDKRFDAKKVFKKWIKENNIEHQ